MQIDDLRVTSFPIKWDENETEEIPAQEEEMVDEADLMPLEDPDVDDEVCIDLFLNGLMRVV